MSSNSQRATKPNPMNDIPFDMADYLEDDEAISLYLNSVLQDGDSEEIVRAIGHIARAKGISQIAIETGLGKNSLYKALNGTAAPKFDTILRVLRAMGMGLQMTKPHTS